MITSRKSFDVKVTKSSEAKELEQLPNQTTVVRGFLKPYGILRSDNGEIARRKITVIDTLISKINSAKTYEDWIKKKEIPTDEEGILDKLDELITQECSELSKPGIAGIFSSTARVVGGFLSLSDSSNAYLTLLLGARSFVCAELAEKNPLWNKTISEEYALVEDLKKQIRARKSAATPDTELGSIHALIKQRNSLLLSLARKMHIESIMDADEEKLFDSAPSILAQLPNPCLPCLFQPNFYKTVAYDYAKTAYKKDYKGEQFSDYARFLVHTFKNTYEASQSLSEQKEKSLASPKKMEHTEVTMSALPPVTAAAPIPRKIEDTDVALLLDEKLVSQLGREKRQQLAVITEHLKKENEKSGSKAKNSYDTALIQTLLPKNWNELTSIISTLRLRHQEQTPDAKHAVSPIR